jgi:hypothetical protein
MPSEKEETLIKEKRKKCCTRRGVRKMTASLKDGFGS